MDEKKSFFDSFTLAIIVSAAILAVGLWYLL
jgi:hypothetical protein